MASKYLLTLHSSHSPWGLEFEHPPLEGVSCFIIGFARTVTLFLQLDLDLDLVDRECRHDDERDTTSLTLPAHAPYQSESALHLNRLELFALLHSRVFLHSLR